MNSDSQPIPDLPQATGTAASRRRKRQSGTWAVRKNFARMEREFGTGARGGAVGTAVMTRPGADQRPPVSDVKPLVESDVLGKVGVLALIAVATGGLSFIFPVSIGFALVCVFVALGLGFWATFRPRRARVLAPAFAATEGLALGVISRLYDTQSHGIVPTAVVLTMAVFVGVLIAYRTRLVRISSRFISMTMVAGFALLAVMLAAILGLTFPGIGHSATSLIVFGVVYLIVAVLDLFVDFEMVNRAALAGVPAEAEWYAAFSIFLAVVMLYLGLLRILSGTRR
ncbi:MAG TPA: Bax inhibitor-1/YccA family protein [Acidimicrobiales bacterium]|nr:Bax inhibitor-1/YccA family protein [Acidimicrobiales bacterium]